MRRFWWARGGVALVVLMWAISVGRPKNVSLRAATFPEKTEIKRIRNRLALIEELLRSRDVSHLLSPELQTRRAKNLDVLHAYWERGVFPKNTNRPGERVPFFIDIYGTPCAVGHLIIESGRRDLATKIASADNNIFADRITDPDFAAWAAQSGLFPEELFLIQPTYDFLPKPKPEPVAKPVAPKRSVRLVELKGNVVCFDTSDTYLMRDQSSSCGGETSFCSTPLRCYSPVTGQYLGGSLATCRAVAVGGPSAPWMCPNLQACADDDRQEFVQESEGWKWGNVLANQEQSEPQRHTTSAKHGDH